MSPRPRSRPLGVAAAVGLAGVLAAAVTGTGPASAAGPANGQLAFAAGDTWYTVQRDGSGLTPHAAGRTIADLAWSADGSALLSSGPHDGAPSVWLGEADTAAYTWPVTNWDSSAPTHPDGQPAWTADGRYVVFARDVGSRRHQLFVDSVVGRQPQPLVPSSTADDTDPAVSTMDDLAWTRVDGGPAQVWYLPSTESSPLAAVPLAPGRDPSFAPDGAQVAFVAPDPGGTQQVWRVAVAGGTPVQLTTGTGDASAPAWSPDGTALAFLRGGAVHVLTLTGGADVVVSGSVTDPGAPAWQPLPAVKDVVRRFGGTDRLDTAVLTSRGRFADHTAAAVVLSRSDSFADALAGTPLAAKSGGPLLLTPTARLDPRVEREVLRVLDPAGPKRVYLLGGTSALSAAVAARLSTLKLSVKRLSGANRFATAVSVATQMGGPEYVFLATGRSFADALGAGAAAASYWLSDTGGSAPPGGAVLLTDDGRLPADTSRYLTAHHGALVTAVGGPAVAAYPAAALKERGADRYETAVMLALDHFGAPLQVGLATGTGFADALAGGAFVGGSGGPLLLTQKNQLPAGPVDGYLHLFSGSIREVDVFGGSGAVSGAVATQARAAIGIGTTYQTGSTGPVVTAAWLVGRSQRPG